MLAWAAMLHVKSLEKLLVMIIARRYKHMYISAVALLALLMEGISDAATFNWIYELRRQRLASSRLLSFCSG